MTIIVILITSKGAVWDLFTISLQCHKLSPTCMLQWQGHNCVQIVVGHVVQRDSSAIKFDRVGRRISNEQWRLPRLLLTGTKPFWVCLMIFHHSCPGTPCMVSAQQGSSVCHSFFLKFIYLGSALNHVIHAHRCGSLSNIDSKCVTVVLNFFFFKLLTSWCQWWIFQTQKPLPERVEQKMAELWFENISVNSFA